MGRFKGKGKGLSGKAFVAFVNKNRKQDTKSIAKRALNIAKTTARHFERKYSNNTYASTVGTTLQVCSSMNLIAQGDSSTTRDGNVISVRSVRLNMLAYASGNTDDFSLIRVIVIRDLQTVSDTYPSAASVLQSPADITSGYAWADNQKRFKVLYDKTIDLNSTGIAYNSSTTGTIVYNPARYVTKYLFPKCQVYFNGTANTDVQKNAMWIYAIAAGTGTVNLQLTTQTCFTDN